MYRIGDFLIKIKNAYQARKQNVSYPHSKVVVSLAAILEKEGYIRNSKVSAKGGSASGRKTLEIELKYEGREPAISEIKLISKPSVHHYANKTKIRNVGYGIGIVSTNQGIMTSADAVKKGIGGELVCKIS